MSIFHALILGLVEGITEFLPVSSTAHLIITSNLLKLPQSEFITFFEVFIQSGAILAVVLLYFQTVMDNRDYIPKVIYSFIPTAVIGFLLHDVIKSIFFNSELLIILMLLFVGILFIIIEKLVDNKKIHLTCSIKSMSKKDAIVAGVAQSFAVVPGVSRAGAVIIGMMLLGYKRSEAALYSFLLAVPTILAAASLDLLKTDPAVFTSSNIFLVALGFLVSFISALFFVKWLISYLQKNSLVIFGVYRIILALALLLFL